MKAIYHTVFISLTFLSAYAFGQQDYPGQNVSVNCKDNPLIKRMPGYDLGSCSEFTSPTDVIVDRGNFNIVKVGTMKSDHHYVYVSLAESDDARPTHKQVLEHYEKTSLRNAKKAYLIKGTSIHGPLVAVYKLTTEGTTYWIFISLATSEGEDLNDKNSGHIIIVTGINER